MRSKCFTMLATRATELNLQAMLVETWCFFSKFIEEYILCTDKHGCSLRISVTVFYNLHILEKKCG